MKTQKKYEAPQTQHAEVELEQGFMKASVFEPEDVHDKGVTIKGHGFGNSQDFTGTGWDDDQNTSTSSF